MTLSNSRFIVAAVVGLVAALSVWWAAFAAQTVVTYPAAGTTVTYTQLLLPEHEAVIAAGTVAETLYVGRLRRRKDHLAASVLAGLDRHLLPEHGRPVHPVLGAFDAIVLAEQRAA